MAAASKGRYSPRLKDDCQNATRIRTFSGFWNGVPTGNKQRTTTEMSAVNQWSDREEGLVEFDEARSRLIARLE